MVAVSRRNNAPITTVMEATTLVIGAFFLRTETELILKSRRVVPRRLIESGFQFRFPTFREAIEDLEGKVKA